MELNTLVRGVLEAAGIMNLPVTSVKKTVSEGAAVDIARNIANGVGSVDYESDYKILFPYRQYEASKFIEDYNPKKPSEKSWVGPIKTTAWRPDPNAKPKKVNGPKKRTNARYWFKPKAK